MYIVASAEVFRSATECCEADSMSCAHWATSQRALHIWCKLLHHICRGIEAVITGLTRNQFVDNTTRGFESLPLRQEKPKSNTMFGLGFLFCLFAVGVDGGLCRERLLTRVGSVVGSRAKGKQTNKPLGAWVVGFFAYHPHSREARVKSTVE